MYICFFWGVASYTLILNFQVTHSFCAKMMHITISINQRLRGQRLCVHILSANFALAAVQVDDWQLGDPDHPTWLNSHMWQPSIGSGNGLFKQTDLKPNKKCSQLFTSLLASFKKTEGFLKFEPFVPKVSKIVAKRNGERIIWKILGVFNFMVGALWWERTWIRESAQTLYDFFEASEVWPASHPKSNLTGIIFPPCSTTSRTKTIPMSHCQL